MADPTTRTRHRPNLARWRSDHSGVAIREMVAIAAVAIIVGVAVIAILEVAGVDITDWLREQLGIVP